MKQCKSCPWRVEVDPHDIPNGYSEELHKSLECTIAKTDGNMFRKTNHIMACHHSSVGEEKPCVGYLANQLGRGNNIGLRLWALKNLPRGQKLELIGEQHLTFEGTLP